MSVRRGEASVVEVGRAKNSPGESRLEPGKQTLVQQLQGSRLYLSPADTGTRAPDAADARSGEAGAAHAALGHGGGEPLPAPVLAQMTKRFGHDFSHVRIHTGTAAAQAAANVGAKAVTRATDIYFAAGQFAPGTPAGDRLLIHELTHVVQHDQGRLPSATGDTPQVSQPDEPAEQEASAAERTVASPPANAHVLGAAPVDGAPTGKAPATAAAGAPILRDPLPPGAQGDPAAVAQLQALLTHAGLAAGQQQLPAATMTVADATRLLNLLLRAQPSLVGVGPRMVAARIVQEIVIGGADVPMPTVAHRIAAFAPIIFLRPDGYISRAESPRR
jgi:hypothetical protein